MEAEAGARAVEEEEEEEVEEEEADADAVAVAGVKVKAEAEAVAVGELPYANRAPRPRNLSFDRRMWLPALGMALDVAILVHRRKRREGPIARAPQDCRARAHSG